MWNSVLESSNESSSPRVSPRMSPRGVLESVGNFLFHGSVSKTNTFEYYSIFLKEHTEFLFARFGSIKRVINLFMWRLIFPRRLQPGKRNCCENLTLNRIGEEKRSRGISGRVTDAAEGQEDGWQGRRFTWQKGREEAQWWKQNQYCSIIWEFDINKQQVYEGIKRNYMSILIRTMTWHVILGL